jgi:pimeloyl-ACP methyl ester carboxylesterase
VGALPRQLRVCEPAWCCAVGLLLGVLATPARALDFTPCAEADHAAFDCATLPVPIDRDGVVPGTISLHVERLRGQAPDLPVLVALAGGPGQSATSLGSDFASALRGALDRVQLVLFDQRGTGLSPRPLDLECENLDLDTPRGLRRCDGQLGPAGAFYRTADAVLDLEAVRVALGVERLTVLGISYGTFLAAEYARTFPGRVERLVLDSAEGPDGVAMLDVTTAHATERVLQALCAGGACAGASADPVGDTARLVRRLARRPLPGRRKVPGERPARLTVKSADLLDALVAGDLMDEPRALYPAAVAAALAGDRAPLLRLVQLTGGGAGKTAPGPDGTADEDDPREFSPTVLVATGCADARVPWEVNARPSLRKAALAAAARALPETAPFPFDRKTLLGSGLASLCPSWPRSGLPGAVVLGTLPEVPVLVLVGEDDLRTPLEEAVALTQGLPRATIVAVPRQGHSVLTQQECAQAAVARFLADAPLEQPCSPDDDSILPRTPVQPIPVSLDELPEAPGVAGLAGRTLTAVERTLFDAFLTFLCNKKVAGLRGGAIESLHGCSGPPVLELARTSLIRGVEVSGTVQDFNSIYPDIGTASVTVAGRAAAPGSLEFHADGRVTGRLGDQEVATTSGVGGELARLAARRAIPVIGARRRERR